MSNFGINIQDGSEEGLSLFSVNENKKAIDLYDWQRRAINYFFTHNNITLFEVSTGAGKTFCAIEILKRIHEIDPDAKCLIVVPKNVILETGWIKELYNNGYSLVDVGVYYGFAKEYGSKITITNMQSIEKVALEIFDVLILDEVHNFGTKRLLEYVERDFKYKIGLSATVERMDNKHWDIIKAFEYNVFKYTPNQAIQEGVLNPFNFFNVAVEMDDDEYEKYTKLTQDLNVVMTIGGGFNKIMRTNSGLKFKMLGLMNKRKQLVGNYVRKFDVARAICEKHKGEKTLIFNQYNKQTNKMYWHLLDVGIKAKIFHSDIKKEDRDKILTDFKNDVFSVMVTTKVLDEGYNLPSISCAVIMAGDSTARQTIQRMGRVLRKKKEPSVLYQVYCKNTIEEEQALDRSRLFKELASGYKDYYYRLDSALVLD